MYTVTTDDQSQQQVDALLAEALAPFAEARAMLEVAPWVVLRTTNTSRTVPCELSRSARPGRATSCI